MKIATFNINNIKRLHKLTAWLSGSPVKGNRICALVRAARACVMGSSKTGIPDIRQRTRWSVPERRNDEETKVWSRNTARTPCKATR